MAEESRQRERALKENISRFESELALLKQQLNRKVAEVKKNEEELRRRQVRNIFSRTMYQITAGPAMSLQKLISRDLTDADSPGYFCPKYCSTLDVRLSWEKVAFVLMEQSIVCAQL